MGSRASFILFTLLALVLLLLLLSFFAPERAPVRIGSHKRAPTAPVDSAGP